MRLAATLLAIAGLLPAAEPAADRGPSLTVYSTADVAAFDPQRFLEGQGNPYSHYNQAVVPGFAVVRELRELDLKAGTNLVDVVDVAKHLDPATVGLEDVADPTAIAVREQRFLFDLVSPDKLLDKFLGETITVTVPKGADGEEALTGTLLSAANGQIVLKTPDGVRVLRSGGSQVRLGKLPGGLMTRPTLRWQLEAKAAGKRTARVTYQCDGLTWRADYRLVLSADEKHADLGAWVTLLNRTGGTWKDARLKLIAGDVQRIRRQQGCSPVPMRAMVAADAANGVGFVEKAFFEYHLYTLPGTTDVVDNSTQQLALFPDATGIEIEKVLVCGPAEQQWMDYGQPMVDRNFGTQQKQSIDVSIRFVDSQANHLGMPLPRGKIRLYKADAADHALEFIGEDLIDHTPRDEKVRVKVGKAFDVVGERTQIDFRQEGHAITETIRVELRNAKPEPVKIIVSEPLYRWTNWAIEKKSDEFEKVDAHTVHFPVEVPANGKKDVEYTVRYSW